MKIKINTGELKKAVADIDFIMKGNPINILDSLLITAENNDITLTVNNLSIKAVKRLPGEILTEGRAVLHRDDLGTILKMKNDAEIELAGKHCTVKGKRIFTFPVESSADDFPVMPEIPEGEPDFAIPENDLLYCLKLKQFVAAPETARTFFRGLWIDKNNILACDGGRLGKIEIKYESSKKFMLPDFTLNYLVKALDKKSSSLVMFFVGENRCVKAVSDNFEITFKQYEGNFLPYEDKFNLENAKKIIVKKQDLAEAVEFVCDIEKSGGSRKKNKSFKPVVYRFFDKKFILDYNLRGKYTEENISFTSPENDDIELTIGFNPFCVAEILSMTDSENITMIFSTPLAPSVIYGEKANEKYLLLPLRVDKAG